ncbi:hypothetical protein [Sedimenticola sp.]|uniref:hypothetical protein n=1 Tax=Sedimenticola sp. TaxID=1940285 RepID=UPI003D0C57DF
MDKISRILGDETGIDAARQLQQWLALSPPVLMITANRTQELKQQVRQLGYRMLNKPIKPHKLKSMLRHFFSRNPVSDNSEAGRQIPLRG